MKSNQAAKLIHALRKKINQWAKEYYVEDQPTVDDFEYDQAMRELIALETAFPQLVTATSPTQKVGGAISEKFEKFVHRHRLLSLGDIFSWEEFLDFNRQVAKVTGTTENAYYCELKIDGLSVSLHYEAGQLIAGATRGDGSIGENVTTNIKTIKTIPLTIPTQAVVEARGEIYLPKSEFEALNNERLKTGEPLFANPRNAAAGTLRQLDSKIVAQRKLNSFIYYYIDPPSTITTQAQAINQLKTWGFKTNPHNRLCKTLPEVKGYIEEYLHKRELLDYQIDGIVMKLNDFHWYQALGQTAKVPKWAIAYKFPAEIKETLLVNIFPSVGRTGKITYNAQLEPVILAGTKVSAASLNNALWIKNKQLKPGCRVKVKKAGDIIPEVLSIIPDAACDRLPDWQPATHCPVCHSLLEQTEGEADQFCVNFSCPAQILKSMEHFASREAMNIVGLGPSALQRFYEAQIITNIADIYRLPQHRDKIINFENFGKKSYDNLTQAIEASKKQPLAKVIYGLGIRHVGAKTARLLAKHFHSIEQIAKADSMQIQSIGSVGEVIAQSVADWFAIKANQNLIKELKEFGLQMTYHQVAPTSEKLKGLKFVITGTLSIPREELKLIIEKHSGEVVNSLTKNTHYLLIGEKPGSKLAKAQKLGTLILTEEEFKKIVGE